MTRLIIILLSLGLLVSGCSHSGSRPEVPSMDAMLKNMTEQDGRACIRSNNFQGFSVLDDRLVSISVLGKKNYLVTTVHACWSLPSTPTLALSSTIGEFCGNSNNKLITRDEACPVRHIYEFVSEEDARATYEMVKARRNVRQQFDVSGQDASKQ